MGLLMAIRRPPTRFGPEEIWIATCEKFGGWRDHLLSPNIRTTLIGGVPCCPRPQQCTDFAGFLCRENNQHIRVSGGPELGGQIALKCHGTVVVEPTAGVDPDLTPEVSPSAAEGEIL